MGGLRRQGNVLTFDTGRLMGVVFMVPKRTCGGACRMPGMSCNLVLPVWGVWQT